MIARGRAPRRESRARRPTSRLLAAATLSVALFGARPMSASASEPDDDDEVEEAIQELLLGETVYAQSALELQVTSALELVHAPSGDAFIAAPFIELGLTDRFQLEAQVPIESSPPEDDSDVGRALGVGNITIGALWNAYNSGRRGFALSLALDASLPSASASAGEAAWGVEPTLIAYKVLGPVHVNLALAAEVEIPTEGDEGVEVSPSVAIGLFAPLGPIIPTLELSIEPSESSSSPALVAAAGALVHPSPEVELGLALQAGLDKPTFGALLMATWEIELAKEPDE